jgi:hypothetical protein
MSKRVKINFETVNEGKYEIIPPEKVTESNARIIKEMNVLRRNRTTKREKALRVLLDNMSAETDEHIAKIPHLQGWIIDAMIEFSEMNKSKVKRSKDVEE